MSTETPPLIFERISAVMAEIGAIGKSNVNEHQRYNFRGIDDVYNALHPALVKHQVFLAPKILKQVYETSATAAGKSAKVSMLTIRFRFYTTDGSFIDAETVGEAFDTSDKATNKAMSVAFKYACFQVFCIPTREMLIDSERDHIELDQRPPHEQQQARNRSTQPPPRQQQAPPQAAPPPMPPPAARDNTPTHTGPPMPPPAAPPPPVDEAAAERAAIQGEAAPPPASAPPSGKAKPILQAQIKAINLMCEKKQKDPANAALWASDNRTNDVGQLTYDEAIKCVKQLQVK